MDMRWFLLTVLLSGLVTGQQYDNTRSSARVFIMIPNLPGSSSGGSVLVLQGNQTARWAGEQQRSVAVDSKVSTVGELTKKPIPLPLDVGQSASLFGPRPPIPRAGTSGQNTPSNSRRQFHRTAIWPQTRKPRPRDKTPTAVELPGTAVDARSNSESSSASFNPNLPSSDLALQNSPAPVITPPENIPVKTELLQPRTQTVNTDRRETTQPVNNDGLQIAQPVNTESVQTPAKHVNTGPKLTGAETVNTDHRQTKAQTVNTDSRQTGVQTLHTETRQTGAQSVNTDPRQTGAQSVSASPQQTGTQSVSTEPLQTGIQAEGSIRDRPNYIRNSQVYIPSNDRPTIPKQPTSDRNRGEVVNAPREPPVPVRKSPPITVPIPRQGGQVQYIGDVNIPSLQATTSNQNANGNEAGQQTRPAGRTRPPTETRPLSNVIDGKPGSVGSDLPGTGPENNTPYTQPSPEGIRDPIQSIPPSSGQNIRTRQRSFGQQTPSRGAPTGDTRGTVREQNRPPVSRGPADPTESGSTNQFSGKRTVQNNTPADSVQNTASESNPPRRRPVEGPVTNVPTDRISNSEIVGNSRGRQRPLDGTINFPTRTIQNAGFSGRVREQVPLNRSPINRQTDGERRNPSPVVGDGPQSRGGIQNIGTRDSTIPQTRVNPFGRNIPSFSPENPSNRPLDQRVGNILRTPTPVQVYPSGQLPTPVNTNTFNSRFPPGNSFSPNEPPRLAIQPPMSVRDINNSGRSVTSVPRNNQPNFLLRQRLENRPPGVPTANGRFNGMLLTQRQSFGGRPTQAQTGPQNRQNGNTFGFPSQAGPLSGQNGNQFGFPSQIVLPSNPLLPTVPQTTAEPTEAPEVEGPGGSEVEATPSPDVPMQTLPRRPVVPRFRPDARIQNTNRVDPRFRTNNLANRQRQTINGVRPFGNNDLQRQNPFIQQLGLFPNPAIINRPQSNTRSNSFGENVRSGQRNNPIGGQLPQSVGRNGQTQRPFQNNGPLQQLSPPVAQRPLSRLPQSPQNNNIVGSVPEQAGPSPTGTRNDQQRPVIPPRPPNKNLPQPQTERRQPPPRVQPAWRPPPNVPRNRQPVSIPPAVPERRPVQNRSPQNQGDNRQNTPQQQAESPPQVNRPGQIPRQTTGNKPSNGNNGVMNSRNQRPVQQFPQQGNNNGVRQNTPNPSTNNIPNQQGIVRTNIGQRPQNSNTGFPNGILGVQRGSNPSFTQMNQLPPQFAGMAMQRRLLDQPCGPSKIAQQQYQRRYMQYIALQRQRTQMLLQQQQRQQQQAGNQRQTPNPAQQSPFLPTGSGMQQTPFLGPPNMMAFGMLQMTPPDSPEINYQCTVSESCGTTTQERTQAIHRSAQAERDCRFRQTGLLCCLG